MDWGPHKLVARRYAGLAFAACIDAADCELAALEAIHLFVEVLDHYFGAVCELDLVFNFHKVGCERVACACGEKKSKRMDGGWGGGLVCVRAACVRASPPSSFSCPPSLQAYLILDEFILGGEIQETSKKVCGGRERKEREWGLERGVGAPLLFSHRALQTHRIASHGNAGHPRAAGRAGPDRDLKTGGADGPGPAAGRVYLAPGRPRPCVKKEEGG